MKVRMTCASYMPISSYKYGTEMENTFSVQFGAIVTEDKDDVTVSIPFSDYWLEITRSQTSDTDDDIAPIIALVSVTTLPNAKPILRYKSTSWIRNAKDFEKNVYQLLQKISDKVASPELDKLIIKVKKAFSKVMTKFDSRAIPSEKTQRSPKVVHDEEE